MLWFITGPPHGVSRPPTVPDHRLSFPPLSLLLPTSSFSHFVQQQMVLNVLSRRKAQTGGNSDNEDKHEEDKKKKSRKPPNTAFRQQRLLAFSPILTPKTVLPIFFAVGLIFGPIGGLLLYASSKARATPAPAQRDETDFSTRSKKSRLIIRIAYGLPIQTTSAQSHQTSFQQHSPRPTRPTPPNLNGTSRTSTTPNSESSNQYAPFNLLSPPTLRPLSCCIIVSQTSTRITGGM